MKKKISLLGPLFILLHFSPAKANEVDIATDTVIIQHAYDIGSTCQQLYLTSKHDMLGRDFLYVAAKEGGLKIYDISIAPQLVKTISNTNWGNLQVMNLSQRGHYLYLALGNHFGTAVQKPGMAIIDISSPANAALMSYKIFDMNKSGAGIIETEGNYAYLGAMTNGLFIIDIADKTKPALVSTIDPSIYFPDSNPDPKKYNARGMTIENSIVYLCYDAGGLRVINAVDKLHPMETGRYSNPVMNGKPRAYNNIVKNGSFVYIAVDYCGLEILDVHDTAHITKVSWWNPWNCQQGALKWFNSNGHTNEIALDAIHHLVFLSSGKSDMEVVNVADPYHPQFSAEYGGTSNKIGTWGVSVYSDKIYLSYICSTIPFSSKWSGIKILQYTEQNNFIAKNKFNR